MLFIDLYDFCKMDKWRIKTEDNHRIILKCLIEPFYGKMNFIVKPKKMPVRLINKINLQISFEYKLWWFLFRLHKIWIHEKRPEIALRGTFGNWLTNKSISEVFLNRETEKKQANIMPQSKKGKMMKGYLLSYQAFISTLAGSTWSIFQSLPNHQADYPVHLPILNPVSVVSEYLISNNSVETLLPGPTQ